MEMSKVYDYREEKAEEVIDYELPERKNLKQMVNKVIVIADVEFRSGRRGEFAVIVTDDGSEYYTFSKPIVSELKKLQHIFAEGKRLRAKICRNEEKGYLYLCSPSR